MAPRRLLARQALLALLVSYLRTGATDTTNFSFASPLPGSAFPMEQMVWSFTLDGTDLFQIRLVETEKTALPLGVTVMISGDRADPSRSMPQQWTATARVIIRTQQHWDGTSAAQEIAQKIDEALYKSNGRVQMKDFSVNPATATDGMLVWTRVPRGNWDVTEDDRMQEMRTEFEVRYNTPSGEGF